MNKLFFFAAGLLLLASCSKDRISGSGSVATQDRNLSSFTRVNTSGGTNVCIVQGPNFNVQVKGYENLLAYMETKVSNNTLEIGYKNNISVKNDNVEVFVTMPLLESLSSSGSANMVTKGPFTGADLSASLSGSGNITIEQGDVPFLKTSIAGSGNINAFGVTTQRADVSISGSGSTEVKAIMNLKVNISGSGTVYYKGQPVVETQISGSGKVIQKP
ncbi:MAG TPA: head GIN domain-containing protein [Flavisolibacter sp.]|nr:head GIN domain-containing protein [Flavisolibacter sp.]